LTTLLSGETTKVTKSKNAMLSVLVVLFVISYSLLVVLVIEQDRTITAQRSLVHQLFADSMELRDIRVKSAERNAEIRRKVQAKTQASQAKPKDKAAGKDKTGHAQRPGPQKPPKDASDRVDERRSLVSI
jgi:cytoskeletal protein RodZ